MSEILHPFWDEQRKGSVAGVLLMRTSELLNLASYRKRKDISGAMETSHFSRIPGRLQYSVIALSILLLIGSLTAVAEECKMGSDLDAATKSALDNAAQKYYQMAAAGNTAALKQSSTQSVASDFSGIEAVLDKQKANFGQSATVRNTYELDAPGNGLIEKAEFFCGIANSSDRVDFAIPNLPAGRYGLVVLDAQGGKEPMAVSFVLQQYASGDWKMAGFFARPSSLAGHDGNWYLNQARAYKAKGQNHDAWFYYLTAWDLSAAVPFMSTTTLDRIGEEAQTARPPDMPSAEQPMRLTAANGKAYNITQLFALPVSDGLGLVVKFQVPDISNAAQTYQDNIAVMKDLVAKYPELREGFTSIVARAVAPSGQDYGTLLAMKDVK